MAKAGTGATDEGRTRLCPSTTSTDATDVRISLLAFAVGLGLWVWWAEGPWAWGIGTGVAVLFGIAVLQDLRKWMRGRSSGRRLGELILSVDACPANVGERLVVRIAQRVRSRIRVKTTTLRLRCEAARIETYGIRDRERRVWSEAFDREIVVLQDVLLEDGDVLAAEAGFRLPAESYGTSEWTRWWIVVETSIEDGPPYTATFPLEVVGADGTAP